MKLKKVCAICVAVVMFFVAMPVYGGFFDTKDHIYEGAILQMAELGILEGVGNNQFNPDGPLNRAAGAKVAAFLMGFTLDDSHSALTNSARFKDMYSGVGLHEWALGWINLVASEGIIVGMPSGNFEPGSPLTMAQWATILIRVLGHETPGMSWPTDYTLLASELGLTENLVYNATKVITRAEMAQMTSVAVYQVERADGKRIIDEVPFERKVLEELEFIVYDAIVISASMDRPLVPTGGNETVRMDVKVTQANGRPAPFTNVQFHLGAQIGNEYVDLSSRLSHLESATDISGNAQVIFKTETSDVDRLLRLQTRVQESNGFKEHTAIVFVSNNGAVVKGVVYNPFTGEVVQGAKIGAHNMQTDAFTFFDNASDAQGAYEVALLPGRYHYTIEIDLGTTKYYNGWLKGSHSDLFEDGRAKSRVDLQVQAGQHYAIDMAYGILKGVVSNLGSTREIYITRTGTNQTVIANVEADGRFMIMLQPGTYLIDAAGGHTMKTNVSVVKGQVNDLGVFSR